MMASLDSTLRSLRIPFVILLLIGFTYYLFSNTYTPSLLPDNVSSSATEPLAMEDADFLNFEKLKTLPLDDPRLPEYILQNHIHPASREPYKLTVGKANPSGYRKELNELFANKTRGFFIEAGANDGEYLSNTLALERDQKWSGLLVEAHPELGKTLLTKKRRAWFADVCLAPYNNISEIKFEVNDKNTIKWQQGVGKISMDDDIGYKFSARLKENYKFKDAGKVKCFPLLLILAAINVQHVDYMSLDVQGVELKILKTLPWDDTLTIDYISTEYNLLPEGKAALKSFMESKGYRVYSSRSDDFFFERIDRAKDS